MASNLRRASRPARAVRTACHVVSVPEPDGPALLRHVFRDLAGHMHLILVQIHKHPTSRGLLNCRHKVPVAQQAARMTC
jgi:hypothetical protein